MAPLCPPCEFILCPLVLTPSCLQGTLFTASFAYQAGVPIELIKALGNWRSDTILHSANMLSKAIFSHTPHHFHNTNPSTTSTSGVGP